MNKPPRLDLNPSSADRWTTCTASPRFILENADKLPPSTDTVYNQAGTAAHEVCAAYLQNREPGATPVPIDEDMRWHAFNYMEYVESLMEKHAIVSVEKKLPLWYMPGRNAMIDVSVLNPRNLHIVDYKYGEGIVVSPVENLQGAIYARSVIHNFNDGDGLPFEFPVTIHIYQPRGRNSDDGAAHTWETTWGEIRDFTQWHVEIPASNIINVLPENVGNLVFAPSDKACQWCPAKGFCAERMKSLTQDFENLEMIETRSFTFPPATTLSLEQRAFLQKHGPDLIKWVKDGMEYNTEWVKAGHPLPGYKLVLSRGGNRYWSDPVKAAQLLVQDTILKREEVIEESTISPKQVEDKLGKKKMTAALMDLIAKSPGSPVLAPEDDKRPSCLVNATDEFQSLENQPAE